MAQRNEDQAAAASVRSFLVADIRGYTSYTAAHGDEAAAELVKHFAEIVSDGVTAWSGTLVELRGDEALAAFESPRSALRAAVELQAAFADESREKPDRTLNVGIGLDAGEAVPVGDGFRGAALNRAARLCSAAEAGQTLASEGLIHLAGPVSGIEFAPPHDVTAKGLDGPVGAMAVTAEPGDGGSRGLVATPGTPTPIPPQLDPVVPLAGRQEELGWLRWHWRRARYGRARCVVVSGVPGIGKTRLAAALAALAHADDAAITYLPTATGISEAVGVTRAHGAPALLVVDDIDAAPRDLVAATVEEAATLDGPVLLLVTHRTEASVELLRSLEDLTPPSMRRELGPLGLDAVRMIASLYAGDAVDELPLADIVEQSSGNPASVHRISHEWSRRLAIQRVGSSAGRAETGRRDLQDAEASLIADISLLERAREGGLLYDDRPDLTGDAGASGSRPRSMCPYKGLEPYDAGDADLFFGRERLVAELTARLVGSPFLAIVGASGSGKSSVIRAGLLPSLAAGALPGSDTWAQVSMRPGDRPTRALTQALCQRFEGLCAERAEVDELIDTALATLPQGGRLVLFIDQFEETFACRDAAERSAFIDAICGEHPGLLVIVALRADHYGHAAAYPALARLLASHHVLVGTLTRSELVAVVERPAERVGLHVERELVDALVTAAGAEPSVLPLLSTALLEAWTLRDGDRLTLAAYRAGGGLHGSVARLAEGVWTALDPGRQVVARAILLRLAGSDEAEGFVRRRVPRAEFDLDEDSMSADVLERLVSARLLTTEDDTVEVTHEALLREWPRLREWLEEDATGHQLHMHLAAAAREWDADGRPAGDLYRGARLSAALDWSAEHPEQLNAVEREFLEASSAATEAEAARQRRTNRNLRLLVAGIGVLLIAAVGAGVFASLEARRADEEARTSAANVLSARSILELDTDPSLSKLLAVAAEQVDANPEVQASLHTVYAADAVERRVPVADGETGELSWATVDPSGRWMVTAGTKGGSPRSRMEVFDLNAETEEPVWTYEAEPGALVSLPRFTPDGTRLVAGVYDLDDPTDDADSTPPADAVGLGVWQVPTEGASEWEVIDWIDVGPCGARIEDVSDRNVLIEVTQDPDAGCFSAAWGESPLDLVNLDDGLARRLTSTFAPARPRDLLSDDGSTAVFAAIDDRATGSFRTVVLDTDTLTERWTGDPNANWPLALNGDGSLLLVEGVTGVEVWDIDAGEAIDTLPSPGAQPRGHFRPQDDAVVVTGGDTTLTLWDTQSGEQLGTYRAIGGLWPQSFGGRIGVVDESGDVPALVIVDPRPRGEPLAVDLCEDADERDASAVPAGNFSVLDGRPLLIAGCEDGERSTTVLLDAESGTADLVIDGNIGYQQAVSPDRQRLARQERLDGPGGLLFGPVTIRDLETGEVLATMDPVCEEYDPASDDYSWYESDPASGCPAEHVYMNLLDWSPDGRYLVGGGVVPTVVWDATTGEVAKLMISDGELGPWDYLFSPDGERLLVSLIDLAGSSAIDVYSTETWELLREVPFPKDLQPLPRLAGWSPDGSTLYVTGQAAFGFGVGRLDRLDGETLEQQGPPMRLHEGGIVHDALAPDGTRLATVAETGELRIWDLAERSLVHEIELDSILPEQPPAGVGWKDDTHILIVTEPGMLLEFTTDADELIALVKESLTRGFTDAECVRYGIDPCPSLEEMRES